MSEALDLHVVGGDDDLFLTPDEEQKKKEEDEAVNENMTIEENKNEQNFNELDKVFNELENEKEIDKESKVEETGTSNEKIENSSDSEDDKLKYLFKNTQYFLIKSYNHENLEIAKTKNVWSTTRANEDKLNKAYDAYANVILIFSVSESGHFQGYARLSKGSIHDPQVNWILPPHLSSKLLTKPFKLDWISKKDLPFTKVQHLLNSLNENKPVKIGRDGQEIEANCGESLCRLFEIDNEIDLKPILTKSKKSFDEKPSTIQYRPQHYQNYNRNHYQNNNNRYNQYPLPQIYYHQHHSSSINQIYEHHNSSSSSYSTTSKSIKRHTNGEERDDKVVKSKKNRSRSRDRVKSRKNVNYERSRSRSRSRRHSSREKSEDKKDYRRHRSKSPKRRRQSPTPADFDIPKHVLDGTYQDYQSYLASTSISHFNQIPTSTHPFIYTSATMPPHYQPNSSFVDSINTFNNPYNSYGMIPNSFAPTPFTSAPSNYDQTVEEFLRITSSSSRNLRRNSDQLVVDNNRSKEKRN